MAGKARFRIAAKAGDHLHVPSGARHAWCNASSEPFVTFIITTTRLAKFFQEVGQPVASTAQSVTTEGLALFLARYETVSAKYGYWNATPEENAAVGIRFQCRAVLVRHGDLADCRAASASPALGVVPSKKRGSVSQSRSFAFTGVVYIFSESHNRLLTRAFLDGIKLVMVPRDKCRLNLKAVTWTDWKPTRASLLDFQLMSLRPSGNVYK
jgi:hypothetical protein